MTARRPTDLTFSQVGMVTLVGYFGPFPRAHGNCFDAVADNGKAYRIVNFGHENLKELLRRGLKYPVKIRVLVDGKRRRAIIHDERIGDAWYSEQWCDGCCPDEFLPIQQRLVHERQEARGERVVTKDFIEHKLPGLKRDGFLP
jgi:hypothetical protein